MNSNAHEHQISVVIPVYQGERTLEALLDELETWTSSFLTPDGHRARICEVLLVHDCGPDDSDRVIREAAELHAWVKPVWLSRNFGQHAATLAGMSSSGGDWVATMDEDGQHDPADLGVMLDQAMAARADVVYAKPLNPPPQAGSGTSRPPRPRGRSASSAGDQAQSCSTATGSSSVTSPGPWRRTPAPASTWTSHSAGSAGDTRPRR